MAGPILLGSRIHLTTLFLWISIKLLANKLGHCGYEFPWSPLYVLPFTSSVTYHEFHHSHNVGNYSNMSCFWDTLFGTNADYMKHLENEKNAKKEKVTK